MNSLMRRGEYRVVRGVFKPRGVVWEELAMGSTNRLWRGRSVGGDWLFKWYRYPQVGVHPEVEIAQYLEGHPEAAVAGFGGKVEWRNEEGEWVTVGLIQRWMEGTVAWESVLEDLRGGTANREQAQEWGRMVGVLHQVLGAGAIGSGFSREIWSDGDKGGWVRRVEGIGEQLLAMLGGQPPEGVELEAWGRARGLWVEREGDWRERVRGLGRISVSGWKSRVHGDLHLGQILMLKRGGSIVVDFEGEPIRSLSERRAKDLPLRDVAGMLRSFAYAGAVSGTGETGVRELQEAFLEGWMEKMELPDGDWRSLLDGLLWEKAVYEAVYELGHRPGWLAVPLRELCREF
ncbi:MAG: phosphotransferase [Verrucomicrobiota bacterium]